MKNTLQDTITIEKQAVYSKDKKHRYELTLTLPGKKGKSILVVCLNPASSDLLVTDTTTNKLLDEQPLFLRLYRYNHLQLIFHHLRKIDDQGRKGR